jgi:hypothetical protein
MNESDKRVLISFDSSDAARRAIDVAAHAGRPVLIVPPPRGE